MIQDSRCDAKDMGGGTMAWIQALMTAKIGQGIDSVGTLHSCRK
jgi:hypothetical protein